MEGQISEIENASWIAQAKSDLHHGTSLALVLGHALCLCLCSCLSVELRVVLQDKSKQDSVKVAATTWKLIAGSAWWLQDLQRSFLCEPNRFGKSPVRHSMF